MIWRHGTDGIEEYQCDFDLCFDLSLQIIKESTEKKVYCEVRILLWYVYAMVIFSIQLSHTFNSEFNSFWSHLKPNRTRAGFKDIKTIQFVYLAS